MKISKELEEMFDRMTQFREEEGIEFVKFKRFKPCGKYFGVMKEDLNGQYMLVREAEEEIDELNAVISMLFDILWDESTGGNQGEIKN